MLNVRWEPEVAIKEYEARAAKVARAAADFLLARYLEKAPHKTGYMKSTAHVEPGDFGPASFKVVVDAYYSVFIEFGHIAYTTVSARSVSSRTNKKGGTWVPPNPALRIAVADTLSAFQGIAVTF